MASPCVQPMVAARSPKCRSPITPAPTSMPPARGLPGEIQVTPARALRVVIADDELLARRRLEDMLAREPGVEIVGTADNGPAAVEVILDLEPDLVFLDVQMPGQTGLEVVRTVGPDRMPATIFVTAYDQHALTAFDLAALDYLVKPFDDRSEERR